MQIEFVILADAVQVQNGRLFLMGGGLSLWRSGVYPIQALMGVGVSIVVDWSEAGAGKHYPLNITIADEANIPIMPAINAQFQVGVPQEVPKGAPLRVPFAMMGPVPIPRPGRYAVSASVGTHKKTVFFDAIFVGQQVNIVPPSAPDKGERGN
jgi:hypothetical protein